MTEQNRLTKRIIGEILTIPQSLEEEVIMKAQKRCWLLPEEPDTGTITVLVKSKEEESRDTHTIYVDRVYEVTKYLRMGVVINSALDYNFPLEEIEVSFRFIDTYKEGKEKTGLNYQSFTRANELIEVGNLLELVFSRKEHNDIVLLNLLREFAVNGRIPDECFEEGKMKNEYLEEMDNKYRLGHPYPCSTRLYFSYDGDGTEIVVLSKGSERIPFQRDLS